MTTKLTKVDGEFRLVVPPELVAQAELSEGTEVTVTASKGRLVAEVEQAQKQYTLEELLAGITPENVHGEFDWGRPVGKERFWEDE